LEDKKGKSSRVKRKSSGKRKTLGPVLKRGGCKRFEDRELGGGSCRDKTTSKKPKKNTPRRVEKETTEAETRPAKAAKSGGGLEGEGTNVELGGIQLKTKINGQQKFRTAQGTAVQKID